jgi:hypothetical protein
VASRRAPFSNDRRPVTRALVAARISLIAALAATLTASSCNRGELNDGASLIARRPQTGVVDCVLDSGCPCPPDPQDLALRINEFVYDNQSSLPDEEGNYVPWVEIYNPTDEAIALGGVPLSDDLTDAEKWEIPCEPEVVVPAKGFVVLFLDGEAPSRGGLHASFRPAADALGQVTIVLNRGTDILTGREIDLGSDAAIGRSPDGEGPAVFLETPTPGAVNSSPIVSVVEVPFLRGDATDDNRVNISDMSFILAHLFQGEEPPNCLDRLDVNDDGSVSVADSTFLGNALFLAGDSVPEPFPRRGTDPTPDDLVCEP